MMKTNRKRAEDILDDYVIRLKYLGRFELVGLLNEALKISEQDFATYQARLGLPHWFYGYMKYFQELLVTKAWQLDGIRPLEAVYTSRYPTEFTPDVNRAGVLAGLSRDTKHYQEPVMVSKVLELVEYGQHK